MKLVVSALLVCLATAFAAPADKKIKWCVKSDAELKKCNDLAAKVSQFSCVKREGSLECIQAIKAGEADAITLDGGDIYTAGLNNYDLHPIIAEDYGKDSDTCYYAIAVAKKGTGFGFNDLKGKKTCHTGLGKSAGWNIPIGTLLSMNKIEWAGIEDKPLEKAVSEYFLSSCAPGAVKGSNLCKLCKTDCSRSHKEPYYDYSGAFQCLKEDAGEVAFIKHVTVPVAERGGYELLCKDGSRASMDNYKTCYLAKVPGHAVVSRKDPELAKTIYSSLKAVMDAKSFNLFSSEGYTGGKDLMFKDNIQNLVQLPPTTDSFLYLGAEYMSIIRSLKKEPSSGSQSRAIKWCAVGHAEKAKCDQWTVNSIGERGSTIECQSGSSVDDCISKIMRKEADVLAVDGGQVFTAGKCGLVPVLVEQYDSALCTASGSDSASSYYAVAVVKKDSGLTWDKLQGKKSCHTGMSKTAGWNVPMGLIHKQTGDCDFSKFFQSGCAPGADPSSSFCTQCAGSGKGVGDSSKCKASADEQYYGYAGAFRCLAEGAGDVAFIRHSIVFENTDGNGPSWSKTFKSEDYQLVCPGKGSAPITQWMDCHLAKVPAHAVVTRPETAADVVNILQEQQAKFGAGGSDPMFRMFESEGGKNLLFKDSTKCLQKIPMGKKYQDFLGEEYMTAMNALRQCTDSTSDLEKSCTFHSCQQKD